MTQLMRFQFKNNSSEQVDIEFKDQSLIHMWAGDTLVLDVDESVIGFTALEQVKKLVREGTLTAVPVGSNRACPYPNLQAIWDHQHES